MNQRTDRILGIYGCIASALHLCEIEVIEAQNAMGDAEVLAIIRAMSDDFGQWWGPFRAKWGIPDHPLKHELVELSDEAVLRERGL